MTLVVETGAGLTNANGYISVAAFKAHHDTRGVSYSTYSDTQIGQAIVRATDYIDRRFRRAFIGIRLTTTQSLEWPRLSAFYQDGRGALGVPPEIAQATAEYAIRSLSAPLAPDPTYDASNAKIVRKREEVGPVREEIEYGNNGVVDNFRKYPAVDSLLSELITQGREMLRV